MTSKQLAYSSLANETDIVLADVKQASMVSIYNKKNTLDNDQTQSLPLLSNVDDIELIGSKQSEYRAPEHTLSNTNVKRREKPHNNNNNNNNNNINNIDINNKDITSLTYTFRPYRCCILLIFPIVFSIGMLLVNEVETLSCSDCGTIFFQCEYFYKYACRLKSIEACCFDVNDVVYCETYKYDSEELHYHGLIMRDLRYAINICGDTSYAIIAGALFGITIIYVIMEKFLNISLFSNIRNYDNIFLGSWVLTSIILMIPLYFYFHPSYLKCSNWNEHHTNDGENILPMSTESDWSMGATLWFCIGSFCQIWLIGFCGCTFNKGVDFDAKNFEVGTELLESIDTSDHSIHSQKLHSLRRYSQSQQSNYSVSAQKE